MNKIETFEKFMATSSAHVPLMSFLLNMIIAAILAYILGIVYIRYAKALSNRKSFSRNFILMTVTTMLIISVVKSSLALSLGLVGALSIVRFRTAIKEPEELAYMFISIALGLGFGADQRVITTVAFFVIVMIIIAIRWNARKDENKNLHLTVYSAFPGKVDLKKITEILKENCNAVNMKRFDENKESLESFFYIECEDIDQLYAIKRGLQSLDDTIKISFLDNAGVY
ncbi:conserved membrane hypothetical protein [Candidatus Desulfarcum epimagneticum]|uniref:DUF4956 domain-containing protein n=1 Tax=uncultured Desulfobacteraceae bacterium TaxID=218296 RepID=A0A484HGW6_9BACT|nr:conserved membrane hypothetical protein [uncultured Desulfobacteraceae bacterium]